MYSLFIIVNYYEQTIEKTFMYMLLLHCMLSNPTPLCIRVLPAPSSVTFFSIFLFYRMHIK